ncbi:hypothetical protein JZ751_009536 [Albula glossodonta]|uniref:Alpha-catulin n=1 Tax=Albula glossodonta TaxID=121402 RepID=A0A8T2NZT4_9TELE|nr:hypothetical protein JZ751_009536 [Albula glossodonta]
MELRGYRMRLHSHRPEFGITTLINHKDKLKKSEKTLQALQRVGHAVSVAVGRFVTVGEAIAAENQELKEEMSLACCEARRAGKSAGPRAEGLLTLQEELSVWMTRSTDGRTC